MEARARELYLLTGMMGAIGTAWIGARMLTLLPATWSACPSRQLLHLSCPGCGGTTAVLHLLHGEWAAAFRANPLAPFVAAAGLWALLLAILDLATGRRFLWRQYRWVEKQWRRPPVLLISVGLIVANWIWNLIKY